MSSTTSCRRPVAGTGAFRTSASASATNGSYCTSNRSVQADRLQCNTARTLLLLDHEPLPWARWGEEFAAAMPAEILQLQERAASADCSPAPGGDPPARHAILPLYRLSRYRPSARPRQAPIEPATDERSQPPDTSTIGPAASRRGTVADAATAARPR